MSSVSSYSDVPQAPTAPPTSPTSQASTKTEAVSLKREDEKARRQMDALDKPVGSTEALMSTSQDEFSALITKGHYASVFVLISNMISDELEGRRALSNNLLDKINTVRNQVFKVQSVAVDWGRKEVADVLFAKAIERGNTRLALMGMEWLTPNDRLKEQDPSRTQIMGFAERYAALRKNEIKERKDNDFFNEIKKAKDEERYEDALVLANTFIESTPAKDLEFQAQQIKTTIMLHRDTTKTYWSRAESGLRGGDYWQAFSYAACVIRNNNPKILVDQASSLIQGLLANPKGIDDILKSIKDPGDSVAYFEYLVRKSHLFTKDEKIKINELIDRFNSLPSTPKFGKNSAKKVAKIEIL